MRPGVQTELHSLAPPPGPRSTEAAFRAVQHANGDRISAEYEAVRAERDALRLQLAESERVLGFHVTNAAARAMAERLQAEEVVALDEKAAEMIELTDRLGRELDDARRDLAEARRALSMVEASTSWRVALRLRRGRSRLSRLLRG